MAVVPRDDQRSLSGSSAGLLLDRDPYHLPAIMILEFMHSVVNVLKPLSLRSLWEPLGAREQHGLNEFRFGLQEYHGA
jgi:hypothetical protein